MRKSPYAGIREERWLTKTQELVTAHPLKQTEIVDVVRGAWNAIFESTIGPKAFRIGRDLFPKPQIMGFFLHELIALELQSRYPKLWRGEKTGGEKDLVYIPDDRFSVEVKTSSHGSQIFGNRSYAQESTSSKKDKAGYYLAVNFEKFAEGKASPAIRKVRFGWLDHADWIGQTAATGQQARLAGAVEGGKLLTLFDAK